MKRKMTLGKLIRRRRWLLGLTQTDLAEKLGVSLDAISKWEHGYRRPRAISITRLADALQLPVEQLLAFYERNGRE